LRSVHKKGNTEHNCEIDPCQRGYIIIIKPIAIGMDVVPIDRLFKKSAKPG
jgi:hypothetical protein